MEKNKIKVRTNIYIYKIILEHQILVQTNCSTISHLKYLKVEEEFIYTFIYFDHIDILIYFSNIYEAYIIVLVNVNGR